MSGLQSAAMDKMLLTADPPIQNRKDMDSTPTHTRLAHMYDVEAFVEGFRNTELNAACVVVMMKDGAAEKALLDALDVIRENDTDWYDRIRYVVPQGIREYKDEVKN
ncbi:hypothetical protein ACHAPU_009639 [Fusarium lateritium]